MTREEILAMEPGRELDALVAEKVMGLSLHLGDKGSRQKYYAPDPQKSVKPIEKYSTDIFAACKVVEKEQSDWSWDIGMHNEALEIEVRIGRGDAVSKSIPEAICKAAILNKIISGGRE